MWAYVTGNTIQEIIRFPKSMVINDVRHPRTIFTAWSWTELNNIGIYTVEPGTQGDDRFEITSQPTYAFDSSNKKVTTTYTKTDKALADSNAVDEDGNAVLDRKGNQVLVQYPHTLQMLEIVALIFAMPLTIVLIWLLSRHYITIHMTVMGILQQLLRLTTGLMTMMYKLMKGK
jgi:hypothetical protein